MEKVRLITNDSMVDLTPELLAELFCAMKSDEQARFYNHIDAVANRWSDEGGSILMQYQYITEEYGLTLAGRRVMQMIGEYSHWGLSCSLGRK